MRTAQKTEKDLRYYRIVKKITRFLQNNLYLLTTLLAVCSLIYNAPDRWHGTFTDSDGYMHALRLHHWLINPSFYEQLINESNYPFGEILHWTRPFDIIWLINTIPFLFLTQSKDIVFMAGAFTAPWLGVLTAIALVYGLRRLFNPYLCLFGVVIFLSDSLMQNYFHLSRPDHQALSILLATYSLSAVLCWLKKRHLRYLRWLGCTLALLTFTAIEGFILYGLFLAFFLYLYIYKNLALTSVVKISKYYAITLTICWLLNPPYQGWLYIDNGRISVMYAVLSMLMFGCFYGLNLSKLHTKTLKFYSLLCASLGTALFMLIIFGTGIYQFPLTSEISEIWSNRINEMTSLRNTSLTDFLVFYPFGACALCIAFWLLKEKNYRRLMILELCLGIPLFGLTILARRFSYYQDIYSIIPFLALLDALYKKSAFAHKKSEEFPGTIWVVCFSILLCQQLLFVPSSIYTQSKYQPTYSSALCQQIKQIGGTLVTDVFLSTKYVWRCEVNTIGTPYHRNHEGILDNHAILYGEKDSDIIPLLLKHQVTQILVFDKYDRQYYNLTTANHKRLYYRLITKQNIPSYLEEVPTFLSNAHLYRIKL